MSDRSRRRGVGHAARVLLLSVAVFVLWRLLGPSVAVVRDSSLAPILENGDIVWIRPARGELDPGAVVLVAPFLSSPPGIIPGFLAFSREDGLPPETAAGESLPTSAPRHDALVPRIAVGFSGDEVTWTDTSVTVVRPDGNRFQLSPGSLHPLLQQAERSATVPEEFIFTVSLSGGMVDSRLIGPRPESALRYKVSRIIWPRDRRGTIAPVEPRRGASP